MSNNKLPDWIFQVKNCHSVAKPLTKRSRTYKFTANQCPLSMSTPLLSTYKLRISVEIFLFYHHPRKGGGGNIRGAIV